MTKSEILNELQQWEALQKSLEAQLDKLCDLMGTPGESPLLEAIYFVLEAHTEAVARIVGDDTKSMWWWVSENNYGRNGLYAGKGNKMRPIRTLKQLAGLIAD